MPKRSTRLEELSETFRENGISLEILERNDNLIKKSKRMQMLLDTVDEIIRLYGKENQLHEHSIISVDGKESRGSKRIRGCRDKVRALQTLNVYSRDYGICLTQEFIEEKNK